MKSAGLGLKKTQNLACFFADMLILAGLRWDMTSEDLDFANTEKSVKGSCRR